MTTGFAGALADVHEPVFLDGCELVGVRGRQRVSNFTQHNTAETLFDRLEAHGRTWKVYVQEPMPLSFTGLIHMPRLKDRLATSFVPYSEFERDAAHGTLPDFSLIEPNMLSGHSDYHPAFGRSLIPDDMNVPMDPPSSITGGDAFLARIYRTIRSTASPEGSNAYNTLLFIGWDEPGGTYDHLPPGPVPPPDPSGPAGQLDFKFDRSGYRVPAIIVSPWVDQGIVINEEHRHTSMIATLRKVWDLGAAFTARDAAAAAFDHLLSRESPRDPAGWPDVNPLPVPQFHIDMVQMEKALSTLGKTAGSGMLEQAKQSGLTIPPELTDPNAHPSTEQTIKAVRNIATQVFPRLASPPNRTRPNHRSANPSLRPTTGTRSNARGWIRRSHDSPPPTPRRARRPSDPECRFHEKAGLIYPKCRLGATAASGPKRGSERRAAPAEDERRRGRDDVVPAEIDRAALFEQALRVAGAPSRGAPARLSGPSRAGVRIRDRR